MFPQRQTLFCCRGARPPGQGMVAVSDMPPVPDMPSVPDMPPRPHCSHWAGRVLPEGTLWDTRHGPAPAR